MNLQPPAVLMMGAPGSGKTDALATLLAQELKLFVICTEPDGISSLLDSCERRGVPIHNLHWAVCPPTSPGWGAMKEAAKAVGAMGYEELTKIKSGIGKNETRDAMMKFLLTLENFVCDRTGESFGDVTLLPDDCAIVIDSLSGLNTIAMMAAQGYKPVSHQGEWGVAMNSLENLILKLCSDRKAFLVVTAHVEKETSEITGASQIMVSTLGRKLAPRLPRFFSEVVYSKRTIQGSTPTFIWSTADPAADLKNRTLPVSATLMQDYRPIVEGYRKRKALAAAAPPAPAATEVKPQATLPLAPMKPQAA
jgi:AAA domain